MKSIRIALLLLAFDLSTGAAVAPDEWQPVKGPLTTRWARYVSRKNAHREYPRPQLLRKDWQNLNGLWDYAIRPKQEVRPSAFDGKILVPFPIESALSGVMKPVGEQNRLWYRRAFAVPKSWRGKRVLLHFGAVDWETTVWVNGKEVGTHRGGYDGFSFDITDSLKPKGENELAVSVWDPIDAGPQPRGKQVGKPGGIWYTPSSGIWQTVWLEPVGALSIDSVKIIPDVDRSRVSLEVGAAFHLRSETPEGTAKLRVEVLDGIKTVTIAEEPANLVGKQIRTTVRLQAPLPKAKLWSPGSPFLYGLKLTLLDGRKKVDQVESYFGMRKI